MEFSKLGLPKSKIFWVNAVLIALAIVELAVNIYGLSITHILFAQGILTIALRFLQGTEVKLAGRTFKL